VKSKAKKRTGNPRQFAARKSQPKSGTGKESNHKRAFEQLLDDAILGVKKK
jgi:hypothetical protein